MTRHIKEEEQSKEAEPVRLATRYDKLARNFLAATTLVALLYWIKL
jgi:hypothetical protein